MVLLTRKNFWESACNDDTVYQGDYKEFNVYRWSYGGAFFCFYHGLNRTFSEKGRYPVPVPVISNRYVGIHAL